MRIIEGILTTTHTDLEGDKITKECLEDIIEKYGNSEKKLLLLFNHDFTLPPIGWVTHYELRKRSDGEYELRGIAELWNDLDPSEREKRMRNSILPFEFIDRTESYVKFNNRGMIYRKEVGILYKRFPNINDYVNKSGLMKISDEMEILRYGVRFNNIIFPFHSLFRRSCSIVNAYNLDLIDVIIEIWQKYDSIDISLLVDFDLLLENLTAGFIEKDYWRGPKFTRNFADLKSGVAIYATPEYNTQNGIKTEFWLKIKDDHTKTIEIEEIIENEEKSRFYDEPEYHYTRYAHLEFDNSTNLIKHFDIAIKLYTDKEYSIRRIWTIDKIGKKAEKRKIARLDGGLNFDAVFRALYMFFRGNPLLKEYFEDD